MTSFSEITGVLDRSQFLDGMTTDGTRPLTGNLSVSSGITIDGVDISAFQSQYSGHLGNPLAHSYVRNIVDTAGAAVPRNALTNDSRIYGADGIDVTATEDGLRISGSGGGGGSGGLTGLKSTNLTGVLPDSNGWIQLHGSNGIAVAPATNRLNLTVVPAEIAHNSLGSIGKSDHHTAFIGLTVGANNVAPSGSDRITLATANNRLGLSTSTNTVTFTLNEGNIVHANLSGLSADDHAQYLLATGARAGATSQIQAFTNGVRTSLIDTASGNLTLTPASNVILSNGKALRSSSFTSGFAGSGWELLDARLELDKLFVRGTMSVYELLINQIRATNGSLFVSSSGKVASVSGSGPYTVTTDGDHGFAVGDLIRAQRFTGSGTYQSNMQVTAVGSTTQFTASLSSGDAPAVGMEFVRLGSTSDTNRRGAIYLTADDSHAPFMDITDGVASFADWNGGTKTKVRLGRLTGISDSVLSPTGYGLWSDNAYLKGEISVANDVVRLDSTGIRILMPATTWASQNALRFVDGSAVELGGLYGYTTSTTSHTIGVRAIGTATRRPAAYVLAEGTGSGAPGAGLVYLAASNAVGSKAANITLDAGTPSSSVVIGGADVVALSGVQNHVYTLLRPPTDLSADLGTASFRFGTLYVNQIIATSVSGATMDGQTWTYPGSMVIDAVSSGNTTVSITNSGAGQADLNVQRNIIVGGTVDGVDISVHNAATAAHGASGAVVGTTNTQTLSNKTLTTPTIGDFTNAQHNHAGAAGGGTISYANLTSRSHALVGADHTASGLTTGHVIRASGATTFAWAQLAHSDLSGIGTNTHTAIDTHIATGDIHVAHSGVTLTAGDGLTGGGTIAASRTFTLGTPSSLTSTSTNAVTATSHTHVIDSTIARSAIQIVAGAGLTGGGDLTTNRTLNVGAGTMITVNADDVAITAGANYQFIGTGSGTAAGWRNVSELAGAGLVAALGALAVGAGAGITVNADDVALTTPGSLSISSPNSSTGNHTHAILTSSNPGAAAAILASSAAGALTLVDMTVTSLTASRLMASDGSKKLVSVANLSAWIAGTTNRVTVTDNGSGGVTLSGPQDIHTAATPTFGGLIAPWIRPASDSTTGFQIRTVSGTAIFNVDTTNQRVGIGTTSPLAGYKLHVNGDSLLDGHIETNSIDVNGSLNVYAGDLRVFNALDFTTPLLYVDESARSIGVNRDPDIQFSVDVAGALRAEWLVGPHAIQLSDATAIMHFDGPGPYNTNFTGTSQTHKGKVATATGGVIYRPGKFGKAVQVAEATTNYILDPIVGFGDLTYWVAVGSPTLARNTTTGYYNSTSVKVTPTATGQGVSPTAGGTQPGSVVYTFSVYAKRESAAQTINLKILDGTTTWTSGNFTLTDEWERYVFTTPVSVKSSPTMSCQVVVAAAGATTAAFYVNGAQLE